MFCVCDIVLTLCIKRVKPILIIDMAFGDRENTKLKAGTSAMRIHLLLKSRVDECYFHFAFLTPFFSVFLKFK